MQSASPHLPIFRSPGQERILARLLLDDAHRWRSVTGLADAVGLAPSSVSRELDRLEAAGLVETERLGNVRRVRADRGSRFYDDLRALLLKAVGPVPVIGARLSAVAGVERAYIFGSWARQHRGTILDAPPRDIDVAVIGDADPVEVDDACAAAEPELGLEVTPVVIDAATWSAPMDATPPFVAAIRGRDLVELEIAPGATVGHR